MSKFNSFAKKFNAFMCDKAQEYAKLEERYRDAKRASDKAQEAYKIALKSDGIMDSEIVVRAAEAKAKLARAEAEYTGLRDNLLTVVQTAIASIRGELSEKLVEELSIEPELLDGNVLELLKSGMLTANDFNRLSDHADEWANPTMVRLIGAYAEKALDQIPLDDASRQPERATLLSVVARGKSATPEAFLKSFDGLAEIAKKCASNPGILDQWEMLSGPIVEVF